MKNVIYSIIILSAQPRCQELTHEKLVTPLVYLVFRMTINTVMTFFKVYFKFRKNSVLR